MAVLQGTKALEAWCQIVTKDYPNVSISNMTSSWRSGLGFCALIHHFRPELLDYDSLNPDNAFENNSLAFSIAEQHLGINALLDPCDMVQSSSLDRLSILTYLSQFYQAFGGATTRSVSSNHVKSPFISKPIPRRDSSSLGGGGGPCQFCQKPVLFLLERYNINGLMAHRTCFKCARCASQLSLANYYETEKGDFCCEICPDEEVSQVQQALTNKLKRESQERDEEDDDDAALNSAEVVLAAEEGSSTTPSVLEEEEEKAKLDAALSNGSQEGEKEENKIESTSTNDLEEAASTVAAASMSVEKRRASEEEDDLKVSEEEKDKEQEEMIKECSEETNIPIKEEDNSDSEVTPEEDEKRPIEEININQEEHKASKDDLNKLPHCHDTLQEHSRYEEEEETTEEGQTAEVLPCENDNSTQERDEKLVGSQEQMTSSEIPSEDYPEDLNPFDIDDAEEGLESTKALKEIENQSKSASLNPFGSDFEDEEEDEVRELTPRVPPPKPPRASQIVHSPCLNPFGSDFEESDGEGSRSTKSGFRSVSPSPSCSSSMTIRSRKKRRAPLPPGAASNHNSPAALVNAEYPKSLKERDNINRRSQISNLSFTENRVENSNNKPLTPLSPDKADGGIWKKKKGPAPPRPIPPKRQVRKIPRKAVNTELIDIEVKQLEFERQGVQLEKTIRELCERDDSENSKENVHHEGEDSLGPEAEDLIIQLFELVNEKNELFRRQTELMYMKREHRLEEEHADLEYQIRVLMNKDTLNEDQKREEEALISRLMTVVSQRNEIVDCLEMDRLRELEEDESIEIHMGEFAAVKPPPESSSDKKKKKKNKEKKSKNKSSFDVDKDIDTKGFPNVVVGSGHSPKPSPKKDKAKKLRKKLLSSMTSLTSVKR